MRTSLSVTWTAFGLLFAATFAGAQAPSTPAVKPPAVENQPADAPIDWDKARSLFQRRQRGDKLTADENAYLDRAIAARRAGGGPRNGQQGGPDARAMFGREKTGLKPLVDMTADDRHQGEDGGLYGGGRNEPTEEQRQVAVAQLARIEPLDANGKPAPDGRIVFVSISMSNATQEFSTFKQRADADSRKSPKLTIVDCAQGGQAMAEWAPPDARTWSEAERRLASANVTPQQVQIAWIKLANKGPRGELAQHGKQLQKDTLAVIHNAKQRFPNLRIAYLGSRTYGGHANGGLNPEPYAYESAYAARWLIQDQAKGDATLNFDPAKGTVKAPLLLWGPYFWTDGVTPRKSDGLVWARDDVVGDGVHPSNSGREKVAKMLLEFFAANELAKSWFAK